MRSEEHHVREYQGPACSWAGGRLKGLGEGSLPRPPFVGRTVPGTVHHWEGLRAAERRGGTWGTHLLHKRPAAYGAAIPHAAFQTGIMVQTLPQPFPDREGMGDICGAVVCGWPLDLPGRPQAKCAGRAPRLPRTGRRRLGSQFEHHEGGYLHLGKG